VAITVRLSNFNGEVQIFGAEQSLVRVVHFVRPEFGDFSVFNAEVKAAQTKNSKAKS